MPLVVPGINSKESGSNKAADWQNQLMGKKIGEEHGTTTFARKDLPETHRVLKPGDMATADHNPDRLNVHVAEDGTVTNVKFG